MVRGQELVPGQGVRVVGDHVDLVRPLGPDLDKGILQIFNVVTGSFWPSPDQDRSKGQSFELHLIAVKDLKLNVTIGKISQILPVARSTLAARTQRALASNSDLTTNVNNIRNNTRRKLPKNGEVWGYPPIFT